MIQRFLRSLLLFASLSLFSCTATDDSDSENGSGIDPTAAVEIVASVRSVVITEESGVTFEVWCDGQDITSLATIYDYSSGRSERLDANTAEILSEGEHIFYALFEGRMSEYISVYGVAYPIIISSSSSYVGLNGDATLSFTVECNGEDVTEQSTIHAVDQNGVTTTLDGAEVTMSSIGKYSFWAEYQSLPSNDIVVRVLNAVLDAAEDPAPELFDGFKRRVMAVHVADAGCMPCVDMVRLIHYYLDSELGQEMLYVGAHGPLATVDPMTCSASTMVISGLEAPSFPTLNFALSSSDEYIVYGADSTPENDFPKLDAIMSSILSNEAKCAISATTQLSDNVISVRADVKVGCQGSFGVGVWLLEDGIYSAQSGAQLEELEELSTHNGVIRDIYPFDQNLVVNLGDTAEHMAQNSYTCCCDFDLGEVNLMNGEVDNCRIVVFVYDHQTKLVDNAITLSIGQSYSFDYL